MNTLTQTAPSPSARLPNASVNAFSISLPMGLMTSNASANILTKNMIGTARNAQMPNAKDVLDLEVHGLVPVGLNMLTIKRLLKPMKRENQREKL